ncbi:jg19189 [Pararge aegeria aegeria]|uniref:Inhibitor of growth protein n=3 Tax=Satyrinae TaxID=42282 RepID=A0A8S4R368_9NEOP|nr:jg19189 [Pararge aegeria aegeria]
MLSQTSTEALLSATYVENYLDCVENLPNDLQRHLSRMRELDVTYRECLRDAETHLAVCIGPSTEERRRGRAAIRLQTALVAAQEIGDEKLQVVQLLQDLIDNKQRSLDGDHKKLISCLEVNTNGTTKEPSPPQPPESRAVEKETNVQQVQPQHVPPPPPPERTTEKEKEKAEKDKSGGERWSKRARRSRTTTGAATDGADSSERDSERHTHNTQHKKGITSKKKKRKARQTAQRSETPPEEADAIDPDEPRYCLCDQISFGEMILCDNDLCPIEWFHFSCVSLTTKPKGKWFCPKCRGDRPNVMKPKGQFLKELERYNREKEEKA